MKTPVGATPLGELFYLFKGASRSRKLVITAHGGSFRKKFFKLPLATSLVFYGPHGQTLLDPGLGQIAGQKIREYERVSNGASARDYYLGKYREDDYSGMMYSAKFAGVDILSVRDRWRPNEWMPSLSDVFEMLAVQESQYDEVHCVFCRNRIFDLFAKSYDAPLIKVV